MCHRPLTLLLATAAIWVGLLAANANAEWPLGGLMRSAPAPKPPAASVSQPPVAGPKPYFGEALGATYYNWGYFGAHQHSQMATHRGYENSYYQIGHSRGY
jgi:hypothetical protein